MNDIKFITDINDEEYEIYLRVKRELKNKKHLNLKKLKTHIHFIIYCISLIITGSLSSSIGYGGGTIQYWIFIFSIMVAYGAGIWRVN